MTEKFLELNLPNSIMRDFRKTLYAHEIKHILIPQGAKPSLNPGDAQDAIIWFKLAIEIVKSNAFWGMLSTAILAFAGRHAKKSISVETNKFKFKATGMSQAELVKSLEDATKLIITTKENEAEN